MKKVHKYGAPLLTSQLSPSNLAHTEELPELSYTAVFQDAPSCLSPVFPLSEFCFVFVKRIHIWKTAFSSNTSVATWLSFSLFSGINFFQFPLLFLLVTLSPNQILSLYSLISASIIACNIFWNKIWGWWSFMLHNISQKYSLHIFNSIYSSPLACHRDHTKPYC